ncbi:MAG: hypothetical protein WDO69_31140 [Pseudomonadota bacterium]
MKKGNVSARKVACRAVFALGCFVFIQLVGERGARAESPRKVAGFEALGALGYGVSVGAGDKYEPYGVMVGLDLGYTLPFGLRIGVDASHGFGRRIEQTSSTGEVVTTEAGSSACGGSVGYDHLLWSSFRLRGAIDTGLIGFWTSTDRGPFPGLAWYYGPKVALIWQYSVFELGLQSKYWVTTADHGVFQVGLVSGVRF